MVSAAALAVPGASAIAQGTPIEEIVGRVQERYRSMADLRSRFAQSTMPRQGVAPTIASGEWLVMTPGKLRVEYDETHRLLVVDGEQMFWYLPEDNQVQVVGAIDPRYTPTLYLAAEGDLRDDFRISGTEWESPLAPGNIQIRLDPLSQDARFQYLVIEVDPASALIARFVIVGLLGEVNEYRFQDIEIDVGLADDLFHFEIPADAQIEYLGR
jgi:outer membrane lipoprotein-sorting protein